MARFRHLPIWKTALEQAVRRFPRYHKYTLGSELRQTAQLICRLVARANEARDAGRVAVLDELVGAVEEMKTLLTLAQEIKAFGHFNDFAAAAELTVSLGQQSGGWRRRVRPEAPAL